MRRALTAATALLAASAALIAGEPDAPATEEIRVHSMVSDRLAGDIDLFVRGSIAQREIPGAVVGLVLQQRLAYCKGYGVRSLERREAMTTDTVFQIGSVTKVFTATLLAKLADEGVVSMDTTAADLLRPGADLPDQNGTPRITLEHLATHASGLPTNPPNRRNLRHSPSVMRPYSIAELYRGLASTRMVFQPGAGWQYSNYGVGVLGHAMEQATRTPFERLLTREILEPLAMRDTSITLTEDQLARFAAHYWIPAYDRVERERWIFGEFNAFGGLASTAPDLATFAILHLRADDRVETWNGPVSQEALVDMRRVRVERETVGHAHQCLGWLRADLPAELTVYSHGGEVDGHTCFLAIVPEAGAALIVLANVGGDGAMALGAELTPYLERAIDATAGTTH